LLGQQNGFSLLMLFAEMHDDDEEDERARW
jgi:hypothetical protein